MDHRNTDASGITAAETARIHRRTLGVVIASQILGGAGLAAGISVGALLAQDLLGSDALAGLPTGLFTLGSAAAAYLVGRSTQRFGRRTGLAFGFLAGGVGALGVVVAAIAGSVPLLFLSLFVYGAGTATNLQARYAGADLAPADRRGFGTSMAMVATTVGAVAGPNLVEPMGGFAEELGIPALAGPFMLAAAAYTAAGAVLFALLRPDPFLLARRIAAAGETAAARETAAAGEPESPDAAGRPATPAPGGALPRAGIGAYLGAAVMVLTQIVMVAIMTMTPVHMHAHHHGVGAIGLVIGMHIGAMWLPSLVTGILVDRLGRTPMVIASGVTLLLAGVLAALAPGDSLGLLILALVLLGLGWNFGLVAGTALVVDATVPANRPRTQGTIDVLIALSGAGSGVMSGVVMHAGGYQALSWGGGLLALALIPVLLWVRSRRAADAGWRRAADAGA
ncbi:MFS transporter [Leucobacter allii]|uniref:MFS transporter n=1 Tax=Leucobacter allii TaxID=2932247 RepID=A0ABY4FLU8_9MICO|nr:MFS transporter [Leucobacter allii]UOQ57195.1 MFS transporter [Leucobacter allii]